MESQEEMTTVKIGSNFTINEVKKIKRIHRKG